MVLDSLPFEAAIQLLGFLNTSQFIRLLIIPRRTMKVELVFFDVGSLPLHKIHSISNGIHHESSFCPSSPVSFLSASSFSFLF